MDRKTKGFYILLSILILIIAVMAIILGIKLAEGNKATEPADTGIVELAVEDGEVIHRPVADFDAYVAAAKKPVFVDFWATWCGPCISAAPFIETLAKEFDGRALFLKVDVDKASDLSSRFKVSSIPLFVMIRDGSPVDSNIGYAPEIEGKIREMIQKQLDS